MPAPGRQVVFCRRLENLRLVGRPASLPEDVVHVTPEVPYRVFHEDRSSPDSIGTGGCVLRNRDALLPTASDYGHARERNVRAPDRGTDNVVNYPPPSLLLVRDSTLAQKLQRRVRGALGSVRHRIPLSRPPGKALFLVPRPMSGEHVPALYRPGFSAPGKLVGFRAGERQAGPLALKDDRPVRNGLPADGPAGRAAGDDENERRGNGGRASNSCPNCSSCSHTLLLLMTRHPTI